MQNLENAITGDEKIVSYEIQEAEKFLYDIEKQYGNNLPKWLDWGPFRSLFGGSATGNYGGAK